MKALLPLGLCGIVAFAATGIASAEEPPYREFVQRLRDRHDADLALQYLDSLQQQKLSPAMKAVLPLEMARTHVAMAEEAGDANGRLAMYARARDEFVKFLEGKNDPALAAEARFDLARLQRLQGKARMLLAAQEETPEAQKSYKLRARGDFEAAAAGLEKAAGELSTQLTKLGATDTETRRSLARERLRADFERALNFFDDLQTFGDTGDDAVKRGDMAQNAVRLFQQVAKSDPQGRIGWQAKAWLIRCFQESDSLAEAQAAYRAIVDAKKKAAPPPDIVRMARYFMLQGVLRNLNNRAPLKTLADESRKWLKDYPADISTPEGYGVRYLLADALARQYTAMSAPERKSATGRSLYNEATRLFARLAESDNEFSERSRTGKIRLLVQRFADQPRASISDLRTFEECYIRAQVEMSRLRDDEDKLRRSKLTESAFRKARTERLDNAIAALRRGLDLKTAQTADGERVEVEELLAFVYLAADRPYEAAVEGEYVANTETKSRHAVVAGTYALEAYGRIIAAEEAGDKRDAVMDTDRGRMRRLAEHMVETWPEEPATDMARHQLADLAMRDKNNAEAIRYLNQIRPTYSAYTAALFDLSTAALQAAKEKQKPPPGQLPYTQQAIAALEKVPEITGSSDSLTIMYYFNAKLRLGGLLFEQHQYDRVAHIAEDLKKRFADTTLDAKARGELQPAVDALPYYARYGAADSAFKAKKYAEADTLLAPFVALAKSGSGELKDGRLSRRALGLALRVDLQLGKTEPAQALLEQLLPKKGAAGDDDDSTAILADLVRQLSDQVEQLRGRGPAAADELKKTTDTFAHFLDQMRDEWVKSSKLTPDRIRFLAAGYASLEAHEQAADLLRKVPRPEASHDADAETQARQNLERESFYHAVQLRLCRELRLAKKYPEAEAVMKELLTTRLGKRSLDTRREQLLLDQDQGRYYQAAQGWFRMMNDLRGRISDAKTQEQYFECYYYFVYSFYKHSSGMKDATQRQQGIKRAAGFIAQLAAKRPDMGGGDLKKRYDTLLEAEPDLKEQFDALQKNTP